MICAVENKRFDEILLCYPEFMDAKQGGILWWCETAEDVAAWPINSVCKSITGKWEDIKLCKNWICTYKSVFVPSKNREFIDKVRQHVPWIQVLSPAQGVFGEYKSLSELKSAFSDLELERKLLYGAITEPSSGLLNLADVKRRDLKNIPRTLSGFTKVDRALGGFRDGELTVWTGKRGEGKSTILGQILIESIEQGRKVCAYSGELDASRFKDWIMLQAAGPDVLEYEQDPFTGDMFFFPPTHVEDLIDQWWDRKFYIINLEIASAHNEDSILNEFEYAYRCLGCDVFLTDNIMTAKLRDNRDYYRAQSMFVRRLSEFCKSSKTHVHLIAHPRKGTNNKMVEDNDEVSGTGDITNLADNVVIVRRLAESAPDGSDVELKITKAREKGVMGKIGLCYEYTSKRYYEPGTLPNKKYGWNFMGEQKYEEYTGDIPFA